jgi:hypothetical protein
MELNDTNIEVFDQSDCTLAPGELIEHSGIYEICHQDEPRASVILMRNSIFPFCRRCGVGPAHFRRSRLPGSSTRSGQPFLQDGDSNLYVPHATRSSAWLPIPARLFTNLDKQFPRRGYIRSRTRNTVCLIGPASRRETNFRSAQSALMECALNCWWLQTSTMGRASSGSHAHSKGRIFLLHVLDKLFKRYGQNIGGNVDDRAGQANIHFHDSCLKPWLTV